LEFERVNRHGLDSLPPSSQN